MAATMTTPVYLKVGASDLYEIGTLTITPGETTTRDFAEFLRQAATALEALTPADLT